MTDPDQPIPPILKTPQGKGRTTKNDLLITDFRNIKPFAFALQHGIGGAAIWYGSLIAYITIVNAQKVFVGGQDVNEIANQPAIGQPEVYEADNLNPDTRLMTHLGWYGNVYAYWEANTSGDITLFDIRGPDEPTGQLISELNNNLVRYQNGGKYYILIGTVNDGSPVDQKVSSDIHWYITIVKGSSSASSSSSSSSSSASSSSSGGSGGSSSKSTCIVPASWHPEHHTALFLPEMPREAVFFDTVSVDLVKRVTRFKVDFRFLEVTEPGSLVCIGYCTRKRPMALAVSISHDGWVEVRRPFFALRDTCDLLIHAIRRGFGATKSDSLYHLRRFPQRNREQFVANEEFINSAYPSHE
jgi:hypothetical protein